MPNTIPIQTPWLSQLLPDGWPVGGSTLITGPGGSGKPLIGDGVVDSWLQAGGSVLFMSLQYPDKRFAFESFRRVIGYELDTYLDRLAFVQLDPSVSVVSPVENRAFAANLVYPEQWTAAVEQGLDLLKEPTSGPGVLLFGSALNLLFFSPTYGSAIVDSVVKTMADGRTTSLFSASTKPQAKAVAKVEAAADNVIYSDRPGTEMNLFMEIRRMKDVPFDGTRINIPIPESELEAVKEIAEHSRKKVIPEISKI